MTRLEFTVVLAWPDACLSPNARRHWRRIADAKADYRTKAYYAALQALGPNVWRLGAMRKINRVTVTYTFHPPGKRRMDDDNAISCMKSARDGLAQALGVDDKLFTTGPVDWGEPVPRGSVVVTVRVE